MFPIPPALADELIALNLQIVEADRPARFGRDPASLAFIGDAPGLVSRRQASRARKHERFCVDEVVHKLVLSASSSAREFVLKRVADYELLELSTAEALSGCCWYSTRN